MQERTSACNSRQVDAPDGPIRASGKATYAAAVRHVAGLVALLYAVLVVAMGAAQLTGPTALVYAAIAVLAPIAVIVADRLARNGDLTADSVAQAGLGIIVGIWALPATSGLVAILAAVAGARSALHSGHRWYAVLAFVAGALIGIGVLALSFVR